MSCVNNNVEKILATDLAAAFVNNINDYLSDASIGNRTFEDLVEVICAVYEQQTLIRVLLGDKHTYDEQWHPWFNHFATPLYPPIYKKLNQHARDANLDLNAMVMEAAKDGRIEDLKILYHAGADIDEPEISGWTCLMTATLFGHFEIVQFLIEHCNADINVRDINYNTPLIYANSVKIAQYLLEHGADINAKGGFDQTALMRAADHQVFDRVKFLIESGAHVNAQDKYGRTPLMFAAQNWLDEGLIMFLLKHGADIDARDRDGRTALMRVARNSDHDSAILRFLLEQGADITLKDNNGMTASMMALMYSQSPVQKEKAKILKNYTNFFYNGCAIV